MKKKEDAIRRPVERVVMCSNLKYGLECTCKQCMEFRKIKDEEDRNEYFKERDEDIKYSLSFII